MIEDDKLNDIFQQEIARELLMAIDPCVPNTTFDAVWTAAQGNPWDCPIVYKIFKLTEDKRKKG